MRSLELKQVIHSIKRNDYAPDIEPNVTEDSLFLVDGKPIGFYLRNVPKDLIDVLGFANSELRSSRVPKSNMTRLTPLGTKDANGKWESLALLQHSCILGAIPAKAHMRRNAPNISSVHRKKSARQFVKAMMLLAQKAGELIRDMTPEIYESQKKIIQENVNERFRFSELFTSSISNYNIAAQYHQDMANLPCVNVIFSKRQDATGGNLTVPDYGATMDCVDNSMIVYPAYRNLHGVTPIKPTKPGGYRNSLVFYSLKGLS